MSNAVEALGAFATLIPFFMLGVVVLGFGDIAVSIFDRIMEDRSIEEEREALFDELAIIEACPSQGEQP